MGNDSLLNEYKIVPWGGQHIEKVHFPNALTLPEEKEKKMYM